MPLDEAIGERYSSSFNEMLSLLATGMTYRQSSKSLALLTGIELSHQGIHNLVQGVGEKLLSSPHQVFSDEVAISMRQVLKNCHTSHIEYLRKALH